MTKKKLLLVISALPYLLFFSKSLTYVPDDIEEHYRTQNIIISMTPLKYLIVLSILLILASVLTDYFIYVLMGFVFLMFLVFLANYKKIYTIKNGVEIEGNVIKQKKSLHNIYYTVLLNSSKYEFVVPNTDTFPIFKNSIYFPPEQHETISLYFSEKHNYVYPKITSFMKGVNDAK